MNEALIFAGFLSAQIAFSRMADYLKEHPLSCKCKHCGWVIWIIHPHVLAGGHDMSVFFIGLLHG